MEIYSVRWTFGGGGTCGASGEDTVEDSAPPDGSVIHRSDRASAGHAEGWRAINRQQSNQELPGPDAIEMDGGLKGNREEDSGGKAGRER